MMCNEFWVISVPSGYPWLSGSYIKEKFTHMADTAMTLIFVRDRDAGRVTIDSSGRPCLHYWPSSYDQESIMQVGRSNPPHPA